MLVLLFHIGTERWAIAASDIKDVLPFVRLQTFAKGVDTAIIGSGLLNYRGEVMPAVDVSAMVAGTKTPQLLSTRIAIVEKKVEKRGETVLDKSLDARSERHGASQAEGAAEVIRLGLILDRASEMAQLAEMPAQFSARSGYSPSVHGSSGHSSSGHSSSGHEASVHGAPIQADSGVSPGVPMHKTYAKALLRGQALSLGEPAGAEVVPLLAIDQLSENMHLRGVS
ncbi:MAG: chemotaxis protein CheW [Cyanobacteria bacterium P01_F01_bin.53]